MQHTLIGSGHTRPEWVPTVPAARREAPQALIGRARDRAGLPTTSADPSGPGPERLT